MPIPNHLFGKKLTNEQKAVFHATSTHKVIFIDADAGTGKTWLATAIAKTLNKKMHYIFAPVLQDSLGLLPGKIEEKIDPFLLPLRDALTAIEGNDKAITNPDIFNAFAWVYASPHTYWRGGNIENAVIVIDEAQNFTKHELKKMLTRIHDSCLVLVLGCSHQCDLKNTAKSGFVPYIEHTKASKIATACELTENFRGEISRWADSL